MSTSRGERPADFTISTCAPWPAINPEEIQEAEREAEDIARRRILEWGAKGAVGLVVGGTLLRHADDVVTSARYSNTPLQINLVPGAEKLARGGPELIVGAGWGQQSADNPAEELFEAFNRSVVVMGVTYPNGMFDRYTLANAMRQTIIERQMGHLGIVGESAGGPMMMMGINTLKEQQMGLEREGHMRSLINMPRLGFVGLNSSPSSLHDAFQGELALAIADVGEKLGYSPELIGKYIYSLFDGPGDTEQMIDITHPERVVKHLFDSLQQTFNDCPPAMVWSQLVNFMRYFNFPVQSPNYQPVLPTDMNARFFQPKNFDPIVDKVLAGPHWGEGFTRVGVKSFKVITLGDGGHADSKDMATALAQEASDDHRLFGLAA